MAVLPKLVSTNAASRNDSVVFIIKDEKRYGFIFFLSELIFLGFQDFRIDFNLILPSFNLKNPSSDNLFCFQDFIKFLQRNLLFFGCNLTNYIIKYFAIA